VSVIEPGYVQTPLAAKQLGDNSPWRQADPTKRRTLGAKIKGEKTFGVEDVLLRILRTFCFPHRFQVTPS